MEQPFTTAVPVSSKDRRYGTSSALPQKWRGGVPGTITAPYVRRGLNAYVSLSTYPSARILKVFAETAAGKQASQRPPPRVP